MHTIESSADTDYVEECDYHDYFESPPHCYWLPHPDAGYMLFTGPSSHVEQVGHMYLDRAGDWAAVYKGWGTPVINLTYTKDLAECTAAVLADAVKEGPISRYWKKVDSNWKEYRQDPHYNPIAYFRWHEGVTYEVKRGLDGTWHATRDGSFALASHYSEEQEVARKFKSPAEAKDFLETDIEN